MSTALRVPHRMTVAEFQDWEPPDELAQRRWELVDGEPVCMSPPSVDHGLIQSEFGRLLGNWLLANLPECQVATTPGVVPRVRSHVNRRIPDLAVLCGPNQSARTLDAPLLVVEILSPSNDAKTRANVWAYTTIPSVREIVLVSSTAISAEILLRNIDGTWPPEPLLLEGGDELGLESIGMTVPLAALYRTSNLMRP